MGGQDRTPIHHFHRCQVFSDFDSDFDFDMIYTPRWRLAATVLLSFELVFVMTPQVSSGTARARGVEARWPKNTKSHPGAILSSWGRNPVAQKHKISSGRDFELVGSEPGGPQNTKITSRLNNFTQFA
jgi:hypothetical protein